MLLSPDGISASAASRQFSRAAHALAQAYAVAATQANSVQELKVYLKAASNLYPGVRVPEQIVVSRALAIDPRSRAFVQSQVVLLPNSELRNRCQLGIDLECMLREEE